MRVYFGLIALKLMFMTSTTILGQEMEIMLGKDDFVNVQILDYERFENLQETITLFRIPTIKRYGVSRSFSNEKGEVFLEFFNRAVIQVKNNDDLQKLEKVDFDIHVNWKLRVPIVAIANIDKSVFDELIQNADQIKEVGELSQIGEFYQLKNGFVAFKWVSPYYNFNKYSILEDIRNANALDIELFYKGFFKNGELDQPALKNFKKKEIVFDENFDRELWEGGKENLGKVIDLLSESLNIDKEELDFSDESFDKLDESLVLNYGNPYELVNPLAAYVGLALTRNHEAIEWDIQGYRIGLKSEKGHLKDLVGEVSTYLIDADYGWPQIKPAMQNILNDLTVGNH